jgi:hypothetical protein
MANTDTGDIVDLGRAARAVPARIEDWERKLKTGRTLNDLVEDIHRILVNESLRYRTLLDAVYDEDAVEGSLSADNILAAGEIREKAKTMTGNEVAGKKLATIAKALNIVLRRYKQSRKERRNMVGGEIIPSDDNI